MEIRHITENDDFKAVRNIYEKSWQFAYKGIIPQDYLDNIPKEKWGGNLLKNGRTEIGAFDGDKIVGTASFCPSRWENFSSCGEIVTIYLLPEYIGRGIGSQLMKACIEELEFLGFTEILLWVLEDNHRARRFYEKQGFVCTDDYMDDIIGGKPLREVMYLRRK
ncbi:GNAT family N-acetyltransferase [Ruminococcus flavefaciens]|jgi:ribosomal protein S18 acetylase RimI-like enzyme|uniref:GNAT family N-acetyltransferase n=1 Tax=Ruminococcus flavefaciens TaxID=1265 RepID=UPI0026EB8E3D|nr:GNAT family N-acetyltransferase [Ruminococcus flavefaciens]